MLDGQVIAGGGKIHRHRCQRKRPFVPRQRALLYKCWYVIYKTIRQRKAVLASRFFNHGEKNTRLRTICKIPGKTSDPRRAIPPIQRRPTLRWHLPVDAIPGEEDRVRLDAASGFCGRAPAETDKSAGDQNRDHISGGRGEDTGTWDSWRGRRGVSQRGRWHGGIGASGRCRGGHGWGVREQRAKVARNKRE